MPVLFSLLLFGSMQLPVTAQPPRHCEGLDILFFADRNQLFAALLAGEIDFYQYPLTAAQFATACLTPDLQLAPCPIDFIFVFAFNNNFTIADLPGVRSPMSDANFRQALAQMVDKDWIINDVLQGFGDRIDAPLTTMDMELADPGVIGLDYPWLFDMGAAAAQLDAAGFDDVEPDGIRNYPADWPGRPDRPNLDPIRFCIRTDNDDMLIAGGALAFNMEILGIPVNRIEADSNVLRPIVMDDLNYHIYTDDLSVDRYYGPMTYLYRIFHSIFYFPGGSNYITGMNASNLPNYPDLDAALENAYFAPDMDASFAAVGEATWHLVGNLCASVWLWNPIGWYAYRNNLVGVVPKQGVCIVNDYTFLTAEKVDDTATPEDESQEPLRMGTVNAPQDLNVLYSRWYHEHAVLDRIFAKLLSENPIDGVTINPWIAQDYEATMWYDPQDDRFKTKVTYWIREDVWWHAPVTGEVVRQFTAQDIEFSIWYACNFSDCWLWGIMKDVHHTRIVNDFTIEVYFDELSIWAPTWIGLEMPLLPWAEYEALLCINSEATVPITEPIVPSDRTCFTGDWVTRIIAVVKQPEGIELIEGVDFEVVNPESCHNWVHWLRPLEPGEWVEFFYVNPNADPDGFHLAGLPWELTFFSLGTHFPVDIVPGVGGHAFLNCNPTHFLGAPPLGELDWIWTWQGTTRPRTGFYQINLFDAIRILSAFCSRGDGVPPPNWFPAADIDQFDLCHVGLFDAVTLLINFGQRFGIPPDP